MNSIFAGIKNVFLWSYERGTWQYDLLCLLIIGVIFLVPGKFFGDRDRVVVKSVNTEQANEGRISASKLDGTVIKISASDLREFLDGRKKSDLMLNSPSEALVLYLRDQLKQDVTIIDYETLVNPNDLVGYKVRIK
jgi:hypothetical protein